MESFVKKLMLGKSDEEVHRQFVRFSRGEFKGRAALSLAKGEKIKLGGSFELASDFAIFVAENSGAEFSGIILSKEEISEFSGRVKNGIWEYNVENIAGEKIKTLGRVYALLLDAQGDGITLKCKKKLPKPGKSGELKIDDKFCVIEADMKYWLKLRESFMIPDCKKCKIRHTYVINEVLIDKNEKDFVKMRENAKKKGRVIRNLAVDGRDEKQEKEFIA